MLLEHIIMWSLLPSVFFSNSENRIMSAQIGVPVLCLIWMWIPVFLASSSNGQHGSYGLFQLVRSSSGQQMCALDQPSNMLKSIYSMKECVLACVRNTACQATNYREDSHTCDLFELQIQSMNTLESEDCQLGLVSVFFWNKIHAVSLNMKTQIWSQWSCRRAGVIYIKLLPGITVCFPSRIRLHSSI